MAFINTFFISQYKIIFCIIVLLIISAVLFYRFVPIVDSPLSGGPVSEHNPPRKLTKVSLYQRQYLIKGMMRGDIVE